MNTNLFVGLINNAALLMALIVIYEFSYVISDRLKKSILYLDGFMIGIIGLAIMSVPFHMTSGIMFDTRSILISVSALIFGTVPSVIAGAILIIYRLILGGEGEWMGISLIISSCLIGILWRKYILKIERINRWLNIYLFGFVVHLFMLCFSILLPREQVFSVFREIIIPVLLIFPIVTVLLSMVMLHQHYQKEAQLMIEEAVARYTSIFNNNYATMLLIDPETADIVDANSAAVQFYGWSLETLKTMKITDINTLSEEDVRMNLANSVMLEQNYFSFQHRLASGKAIDVEVYSGPIMINGKKLNYSIIHDISDRTLAINALLESEERFRLLIESAPEAIFIQTEGKFSYLNQFAVSLFGAASEDELLGSPVMERFHPDYHEIIRKRIKQLNLEKIAVLQTKRCLLS